MTKKSKKPVVVDLFCGAGGMSLGFEMAGYRIGLGIDKDQLACQTHSHIFCGHTVCADLQTVSDPAGFLKSHDIDHVDVIIGGPPCQGFSRVGRGKLRNLNIDHIKDPRNQLYREFMRFIASVQPLYFVMENVPDMVHYRDGDGKLPDKIKKELTRAGYAVDMIILLAADFGVPQLRRRFFMVGNRLGVPVTWPKPAYGPGYSRSYVTVWDAICDLPVVGIKHRLDAMPYTPRCQLTEYQRFMRRNCDEILYNHQTRWHNTQDLLAFSWLPEGGKYSDLPKCFKRYRDDIFKDKYRKLIQNQPSWTIEAHIGKDTYRYIYPSRRGEAEPPRTISVREAARLQSFPDSFCFAGPFTRQFYQVGNAVPPLLAKAIAGHIKPHILAAKRRDKPSGPASHVS